MRPKMKDSMKESQWYSKLYERLYNKRGIHTGFPLFRTDKIPRFFQVFLK